jgi:hypothetical protein
MQMTFVANFYDETFTPKLLTIPTPILYQIEVTSTTGYSTITGSVMSPANVISYTFDVQLPEDTIEATGYLLAGSFQTFSCGGGGGNNL